ncbi:MAG TPA: hypothetical protein VN875_10275 [Candidatus Binatus sp.]|nr:hypothetical protein [Candidatus Binatus sp.]
MKHLLRTWVENQGAHAIRRRSYVAAGVLVAGLCLCFAYGAVQDGAQTTKNQAAHLALFHPDPQHVSNRLYRELHTRSTKSGNEYGYDDLDPLLWLQTEYLLHGPSHVEAVRLLDEFLHTRAEQQIPDPVRRAILQRDLWAVFDWATPTANNEAHPERLELAARLAPILRRLSLTKGELNGLPDTYAKAIASKEFPPEYDPEQAERAFLPADLFDSHGPWVCIGTPDDEPMARMHEEYFGRSVFFVFLRLPGGRAATLAHLNQLADMQAPLFLTNRGQGLPEWNPDVPQFPVGTELALIRKLVLPDAQGNLIVTPVVESVQIRHYRKILHDYSNPDELLHSQTVVEIKLDRGGLFSEEHFGLRAVTPEERAFPILMVQEDAFEEKGLSEHIGRELPMRTLSTCTTECHGRPGTESMMSLSFREKQVNPHLAESTPMREAAKVIAWKQTEDDWRLLLQLWNSNQPSR